MAILASKLDIIVESDDPDADKIHAQGIAKVFSEYCLDSAPNGEPVSVDMNGVIYIVRTISMH